MIHQQKRIKKKITSRPAPYLQGLYSMQAVAIDPRAPDVTVYRTTAKEAVAWKDLMVMQGKYSHFLLQHGTHAWDVYGVNGKIDSYCDDVIDSHVQEYREVVEVDAGKVLAEAREVTAEMQLQSLCRVESHAGARSADHANFTRVVKSLLIDASEADINHLYLIDSRLYSCRVVTLGANVARLGLDAQNRYLDMFSLLRERLPIDKENHLDTLSSRVSRFRLGYVDQVLETCYARKGEPEFQAALSVKWHLASENDKHVFCHKLVRLMQDAITYPESGPEVFDESAVLVRALDILDLLVDVLKG